MQDNRSLQPDRPRRRHSTGKWLMAVFAVVFVAAIVVVWFATNKDTANSHSSAHVPPSLGEMDLIGQVTGDKALSEIGKLHGKDIQMVDGYIAQYGKGHSQVTAWIAEAPSDAAASNLVTQMVDRIGQGNPMFTDLKSVTIQGKQVHTVKGDGGEHFFYASGVKVVWLAIQGTDSTQVVQDAFKTF